MQMFIHEDPVAETYSLSGRTAQIAEQVTDAPSGLLHALYGVDAPKHVFVLVDATLRTQVTGIFDLDAIDHPCQCLFDGAAAEDYGDAAPWLIDLSIRDPSGDLSFHRDFFARHWGEATSILVQADVPMAQVRRHFRRFTQLTLRDDGRRLFFRFWDPRVLPDFLRAIRHDGERARRLMMTDGGVPLRYITPSEAGAHHFRPDAACDAVAAAPMYLTLADFDPQARKRAQAHRRRMAQRIIDDFPAELAGRPFAEIDKLVGDALLRFRAFGFTKHSHLHFFAVWTVHYGLGFEEYDTSGLLQKICRSDAPADERFREFRKWFDTFTLRA